MIAGQRRLDRRERERRAVNQAPRQSAIIVVLAIAGLCSSIMFTLVIPIQARLPELLNASRDDTAWVVTATLLASAVSAPIAGRLGDMYGKRRVVLALVGLLILGSLIASVSHGIEGVIVGRALQGPMAGVVPLGISIFRDFLDGRRINSAIAFLSATLGVGGAVGLPLSALITQYGDWRLLFVLSGGLGIAVFILVIWFIPSSTSPGGGRFDYLGAIGLTVSLVSILLVVSRGNDWGWSSLPIISLTVGGTGVLVVWAWHTLRSSNPILDLRTAAHRPVLLTNLASMALGFSLFVSSITYPQLLALPAGTGSGFGMSLVGASLIVAPLGLTMMALSPVAGRLAKPLGPRTLLIFGSIALVIAYAYSLCFHSEVWHIFIANILVGVGLGLGYAALPMLIMASVDVAETGQANGLNALARSLGTSMAAAVVGAVLAATSITHDGVPIPSSEGFQDAFVLGGAAALIALVLSLFIPGRSRSTASSIDLGKALLTQT